MDLEVVVGLLVEAAVLEEDPPEAAVQAEGGNAGSVILISKR